jgi:hypothetical protein
MVRGQGVLDSIHRCSPNTTREACRQLAELVLNTDNELRVLTDYDNVPSDITRGGAGNVVSWIFAGLEPHLPRRRVRLTFKLFGGWYEGESLSKEAQLISAELASFPQLMNLYSEADQLPTTVNAYLAHSLETLPRRNIRVLSARLRRPVSSEEIALGDPVMPVAERFGS